MTPTLDELFAPWLGALGKDYPAYRHHVERLLALCELLAARAGVQLDPVALRVAAVYHDLGIWSDGTFDYLAPSAARAAAWLESQGQAGLAPLVAAMIAQHHKIRPAGPANDPVEIFRRADWMDVSLGLLNAGLPRAHYRELLERYPDAGFHWRLVQLSTKRALTNPLNPLPMFRW
ncbi:MAG: Metal dependent phosphohydrolase [Moraxellaceae bacterium]|jgi:predicted metal-dependent HD superfamily phosphohydrolase|nr:Metal dependent phosphohydrolase [Moraxellaceae bacterium]